MVSSGSFGSGNFSCTFITDRRFVFVHATDHQAAILGVNEKHVACRDISAVGRDSADATELFGRKIRQCRNRSLRSGSGMDKLFRDEFAEGKLKPAAHAFKMYGKAKANRKAQRELR